MNTARTLALTVTGVALAGGLAACTSTAEPQAATSTPVTTPPPSATPAPTPAAAAVDPLDGGKPSSNGVVAVKIDDTGNGRPQRNIDKADVVYIEEVEGGLTRLVGVFHTSLPTVGSVRSTRPADPELVTQYGPIAYVASGGARVPLRILDKSDLKTTINDRNGPGFARVFDKLAPYNLTANLAAVAKAKKAPTAKSVGFAWASASPQLAAVSAAQLGAAGKGTRIETRVGGTAVEFRYDAKTHRYTRYIAGTAQRTAAGKLISTPNVLVQLCKVTPYPGDTDVNGNPNQYTHSVGSGSAILFRDGKRVAGTWSRAAETAGTTFVDAKRRPLVLRPGGLWVVLTKNGQQVDS